jgi:hypothetical protein
MLMLLLMLLLPVSFKSRRGAERGVSAVSCR